MSHALPWAVPKHIPRPKHVNSSAMGMDRAAGEQSQPEGTAGLQHRPLAPASTGRYPTPRALPADGNRISRKICALILDLANTANNQSFQTVCRFRLFAFFFDWDGFADLPFKGLFVFHTTEASQATGSRGDSAPVLPRSVKAIEKRGGWKTAPKQFPFQHGS